MGMNPPRLTAYVRTYCHLCTDLMQGLVPWQGRLGFTVEAVDVDADPGLEARYGERVPVLVGPDGREICHYFLDESALMSYFGVGQNPVKSSG